ncbi:uncharacterized protein LOC143149101 [Ptiloglossa arizonensis]|uniref:uncharacterized protein LOC143149101 n=1 Tax=Ptiloglossa arizonensis TaxID=3350558 RepID=UPI003FA049B7
MTRDKCSVQGCSLGSRRMRALPNIKTDKERRLKWIAACGNPSLINRTSKNLQICDEHFEARYKLNSRLSKSAVPTLHLPKPENISCLEQETTESVHLPESEDVSCLKEEATETLVP